MQTSSCLPGPFGATHRHEDEWGSVSAWENIGGTQMPTNPLSRPPSTPSWKYRETFFPRWQHKQLFQSKFQQRRLSLETIGSLMGQSPLSARGLQPSRMKRHQGVGSWAVLDWGHVTTNVTWRTCTMSPPQFRFVWWLRKKISQIHKCHFVGVGCSIS